MHATPPRRLRERLRERLRVGWLLSGLAVVVALALTAVLIRLQEGACAAGNPDDKNKTRQGHAIYYATDRREVSCSYGTLSAGGRYVALAPEDYAGAAACGTYIEVAGPRGMVRVQAVDRCRGCDPGELDLSRGAFVRIADPARGRVAVRYRVVRDPRPVRALSFRVKRGSSGNWLGLMTLGHGNRIDRLEVRPPGRGWRALRRGPDNYWTMSGAGRGPFAVRVTDAFGHRAVVRRIALAPGSVQRTRSRLYESPPPRPMTAARHSVAATESPRPTPTPGRC